MKDISKLTLATLFGAALALPAKHAADKASSWADLQQRGIKIELPYVPGDMPDIPETPLSPAPPQPWGWVVSGKVLVAASGITASGVTASGVTRQG